MTLLISLGRHCQAAHQIGRVAGPLRQSHFFDWLITPHHGLLALLANRFNGFLAPANLRVDGEHDGFHRVTDSAFGVEMLHDFPITQSVESRILVAQTKYAHLAQRFLALPGGEDCIFIRHVEPEELRQDNIRGLYAALGALLNPGFRLVIISEITRPAAWTIPGITILPVVQPEPYVWTGSDTSWDLVFDKLLDDRL